jgi:RNA polymerase sigma-70 factor (ECF subfamily)
MFATTHWSLILAARDRQMPAAEAALAELCAAYWYPIYAFIRRSGRDAVAAEDLTQDFFARLLEKSWLGQADQARGRFRSFLVTACRNFLTNEHDREIALKRGGGRVALSFDFHDADDRYAREPAHDLTPERLFERRYALALLDKVMTGLRAEYTSAGKKSLFDALKGTLESPSAAAPYADIAEHLGISAGAVKVAAHRLRQRYCDRLRAAIVQTLDDPAGVEDEIRYLFTALAVT